MRVLLLTLALSLFIGSCAPDDKQNNPTDDGVILLESSDHWNSSTTAGNLVADAIRNVHDLDVVLYPSEFLQDSNFALVEPGMSELAIEQATELYPPGSQDQFMVGIISGKDLKSFIFDRVQEKYTAELQVSGLWYDIRFTGGVPTVKHFTLPWGRKFEDDKNYRVAISNFFYFNGLVFPAYKYRNSMSFVFRREGAELISARDSVSQYLKNLKSTAQLTENRAKVQKTVLGSAGVKSIPEIQGEAHISPYYGYRVTTRGIVTAVGVGDWFPRGLDLYIQTPFDDGNPKSSEALHVSLSHEEHLLKVGQEVLVTGIIYEQMTSEGLSRTGLRDVESIEVLHGKDTLLPLPHPISLGKEHRRIPDQAISRHFGNLNLKESLDLRDAIDFFESLEGMRISINNPRVVGFRGGQEELESQNPKSYLNLYVVPDGLSPNTATTPGGGVIIDGKNNDYNPEIMRVWTHHLSEGLSADTVYNVGDVVQGRLTGVLGYEKNLFGGGEFALLLSQFSGSNKPIRNHEVNRAPQKITSLSERGQTQLLATPDHLTVGTFNIENLAGHQTERLKLFAESISVNLGCPDILNLVEIQDHDGQSFSSESTAEETLKKLIERIDCSKLPFEVDYKALNIDPILNSEGGQPGGNIRVAMLYNAKRVEFDPRYSNDPLLEAVPDSKGNISPNPGRIFPEAKVFRNTRRSLVAQFKFKGDDIFVIGNHFNSKLGDDSLWGAEQPAILDSEQRRIELAQAINEYVHVLQDLKPKAHIIVMGDFNANYHESAMKVLEGRHLKNLINYKNLVAEKDRYTTNYNGNSQALDYILAGYTLLDRSPELEILHINSDYMGRLSDHDPLVARFYMGN